MREGSSLEETPAPWVEVLDLHAGYAARGRRRRTEWIRAVSGVSLQVAGRETLGLVGESGCGKSTLARTLMRLHPPISGDIRFKGRSILDLKGESLRTLRRSLQMVFQDPYASLNPRHRILRILTESLRVHGLLDGSPVVAATTLLDEVGLLPSLLDRYPFELSGGQRQRVCLARALSLRPSFLVLDEAVSSLDVSVQAQALNLLMDLRDRHALSYLFISHDLGVVRHLADRVAVMYLGRIVECGTTGRVMDTPMHPYTEALISAVSSAEGEDRGTPLYSGDPPSPSHPPSGCPFHPRCARAHAICTRERPDLRTVSGRTVACHLAGEA
jgi:peptide/nickel transport system ATP-binding protein